MEAHENSQVGIRASPPKQGRFRVPTEEHLQQFLHHGQRAGGAGKAARRTIAILGAWWDEQDCVLGGVLVVRS